MPISLTEPLAVTVTDPAAGSTIAASPDALVLTFNRAINPDTLLAVGSDVILGRLAEDEEVWFVDLDRATLHPAGTALTVPVGQPLTPGHYLILIDGNSGLADIDGTPLISDREPLMLAEFTIAVPGIALDGVADLGTIAAIPIVVPGILDFRVKPYDVALYKIRLAQGHFWRLGLEVSAQRDGVELDTALALFDDLGRPLATGEVGRGGAPYDPYLFAGLAPGTYYVGVSGTGNLPGAFLGYDAVAGSVGSVPQIQVGGPFRLHLVADPADEPPRLLSFAVDRADPRDRRPTGLTLGFSGAIRIDGRPGGAFGELSDAIEVVDRAGRLWAVVASGYEEAEARVSYLFRRRLPEGDYTVRLPGRGGLVDLAGLSPVAAGRPAGGLGTFTVAPGGLREDPSDLGALLPDDALAGVAIDAALAAGESIGYRLVITFPSLYTLQGRSSGGGLAISLSGPGWTLALDAGEPDAIGGTNDLQLQPGVYLLRLEATGAEPVTARLLLKAPALPIEMFAANGIGQGPALSLRLISPRVSSPPDIPVPTPSDDRPASSPSSGPTRLLAEPSTVPSGVGGEMRGPSSAEHVPEPRPVRRGVADRMAGPSPIGAPRGVRSRSFLGLGGDYIGRPARGGPLAAPALSASPAGATVSPADAVRPLQGIGPPSGSMVGHISGRSLPRGDGIDGRGADPAASDDGTTTVDAGLEDLLRDGTTRPAGVWKDRSEDVIADFLEPGPPGIPSDGPRAIDGLHAEVSLPMERAATGIGQELARVEGPRPVILLSIGMAVSLAVLLRQRKSRILGRLQNWKAVRHRPSIPQHA